MSKTDELLNEIKSYLQFTSELREDHNCVVLLTAAKDEIERLLRGDFTEFAER